MEHRRGNRYPTEIGVTLTARGGTLSSTGRLCDISVSGAFVRTALQVEPLTSITVQLPAAYSPLKLGAQVIRQTADGIAVEWPEYLPGLIQQVLYRQQAVRKAEPGRALMLARAATGAPTLTSLGARGTAPPQQVPAA